MTPPKRRLRAALYGRVSLNMYGDSRSPDQQQSAGEAACADEGWINAGAYGAGDGGASRLTKKARAEWARLLDDIRAGRIDVVIVWEWSRADRNLTSGSEFLDLCRELGVLIHVVVDERTYDVKRRAKDWEILAKGLVDNAMEVERTSQRSKRDRAARVEAGIVDGAIAYGYRRIYDVTTRRFIRQEADPVTAPIVREIVRRVREGEPIKVIADDLTARHVPTPKGNGTWCRSTVRDIALNPAYISRRLVEKKLWPVDWPPLVSEAEHYAVVSLLRNPARTTTRPGRAVHLLTYIATCGRCDAVLASMKGRSADGSSRLYTCSVRGCASISMDKLDEAVLGALLTHLAKPAVYRALTRVDDSAGASIADELGALQSELATWREMAGTGFDPETIAAAVRTLVARIEETTARRDASNEASGALRLLLDDGTGGYAALAERWVAKLGVAQRREVVREVLEIKVGPLKYVREPGVGIVGERPKRISIEPRGRARI